MPDRACRLGVLALGDSITNGGGELQWGIALQSWGWWVARGLGVPFTSYAVDGARAADVAEAQPGAFAARAADPGARYDVGTLHVGANDVRAPDWDPAAYERRVGTALGWLAGRCERVLACTLPLDLGRPRAGARVEAANAAVRRAAIEHGALLLGLDAFGGRTLVMVDAVHLTALGQIALAERALAVLAEDGLPTRAQPRELVSYETTRWKRLRGDATYAYRQAKQLARIAAGR